jgi:phosphatidate cytidylyltransferase
MSNFLTRSITSLLLICLILPIIIFAKGLYSLGFFILIVLFAAWEWSQFLQTKSILLRVCFVVCVLLSSFFIFRFEPTVIFAVRVSLLVSFVIIVWLFLAIMRYQSNKSLLFVDKTGVSFFIGIVYLSVFLHVFFNLHNLSMLGQNMPFWMLFLLVLISLTDTSAYLVGRAIGKRSLISRVSPNKTIAGFVGGLLIPWLCCLLFVCLMHFSLADSAVFLFVCFLSVLASIIGDLMISFYKRLSDIKDTGKILPGHGGLLDRLDSIIPCSIVFYLGIHFFGLIKF